MQTNGSEQTGRKKRILISLKPASYRNLWIVLVVLHALHAAAFGDEAYVFFNTLVHDSSLNRNLQVYRLDHTFNTPVSAAIVFTSGFACVWHGLSMARALFWSFRQRKLAFHRLHSSSYQESRILKSWSTRQISGVIVPSLQRIHSAWLGVFGLESRHFGDIRDVRELVEIGAQTYMVYFTSKAMSSRVLTSFGAVALTLNCWSTPLIDLVWSHRDESKARYFRLLVGIWLACCFTIRMRALEYDTYINDNKLAKWYNIEWTVNNLSQLLHMIINSWSDMIMSRLNLLTMTIAMETLKARVQHPAVASMVPRIVIQDAHARSCTVVPFGPAITLQSETRQTEIPATKPSTRRQVLFYICGTVICGMHVSSSIRSSFVESRRARFAMLKCDHGCKRTRASHSRLIAIVWVLTDPRMNWKRN